MNRLRVAILSLLVLACIAGALPLTASLAKWSRSAAIKHHRRHRHHSRAWWRRHRALARSRRERAERLRLGLAPSSQTGAENMTSRMSAAVNTSLLSFNNTTSSAVAVVPASMARSSQLPFGFTPPHTWTPLRRTRTGETVFAVLTPEGRPAGTAVVSPVSLSGAYIAAAPTTAKTKTVGGLPTTALRRTVIDRMVAEGGWVTNDYFEESQGRRVFVVLAQTGAPGAPTESLTFYFTEIDGRVYSLATTTPVEFAEPVAAGSAQFLASLHSASNSNLASQK
ncbi:MAG TPA: hypothetical protein VLJ61_01235 [Pyrinomonadaceae bacterium]|nr:hypothetical protein [Pyrinomonadaceae bacterium]